MSGTHSHTVRYVADTLLPEQPAPSGAIGIVPWLRQNLFAGVGNSILTILSVVFLAWLTIRLAPWFINGVWNASSLAECREILGGATGGCFAVLRARFDQLMFGFYPSSQLWRPILTLALFIPAVIPILGEGRVRRLWPLSLMYPVAAYYLLFGASYGGVAAFLLGPVLGAAVFFGLRRIVNAPLAVLVATLVTFLYWIGPISFTSDLFGLVGTFPVVLWPDFLSSEFYARLINGAVRSAGASPIILSTVGSASMGGALLAMIIGVAGIVLSFPIGILLALGRQSDMPVVKMICVGFIEIFRGVPLIILLFIASTLLNYFLPPGVSFDLLLRVIVLVVIFASAYMAEVIRGGLAAVPKGQYEAAQAMGLPYWDSMRLIILPQALKVAVPGIVGTFIGLFKDTTLVSVIGLKDVLGIRTSIESSPQWKGVFWELFLFSGVFFFICCFAMSRYSMYVERKLDTGHRN